MANEKDAASAKRYVNACVRNIAQQFAPLLVFLCRVICNTRDVGSLGFILLLLLRGPLLGVVLQHSDDMHCARALFFACFLAFGVSSCPTLHGNDVASAMPVPLSLLWTLSWRLIA